MTELKNALRETLWPSKEYVQHYCAAEGRDWRPAYLGARLRTLYVAGMLAAGAALASADVYHALHHDQERPAAVVDTLETRLH